MYVYEKINPNELIFKLRNKEFYNFKNIYIKNIITIFGVFIKIIYF